MTRHALDRARERYGVTLSSEELAGLAGKIVLGEAEFLGPANKGAERWRVFCARINFAIPVVFDPRRRWIITVLSPLEDQVHVDRHEIRRIKDHIKRRRRQERARKSGRGR